MGCLVTLLALITPRVAMASIWIFTDWIGRAYETTLWPVLGFIFMPYTALAYMAAMHRNGGQVSGWWIVLIVAAVILDLSSDSTAGKKSTSRKRAQDAEWKR